MKVMVDETEFPYSCARCQSPVRKRLCVLVGPARTVYCVGTRLPHTLASIPEGERLILQDDSNGAGNDQTTRTT